MKTEKLSEIKKELRSLNHEQLVEITLRLTKYKKDNKEFLNYVLYNADDPLGYGEEVKAALLEEFQTLKKYDYRSAKELRKILRSISKHAKYTGTVEVEIELLLWFCRNYLVHVDTRSNYKPLQTIFVRQLEKLRKQILKLHEDLQFDYSTEFDGLLNEADERLRWLDKKQFEM
ncbi:hypothetical protein [Pedobacter sp. SYSU D00535]|uniref:hypothetical protein n=1 Tax=Pedobacter sp. SYSU D00535 TaxID=2810308 RepID=UPI001A976AFE|nr:hypothetical protein [Pedobacter sp. SYSU D00535]